MDVGTAVVAATATGSAALVVCTLLIKSTLKRMVLNFGLAPDQPAAAITDRELAQMLGQPEMVTLPTAKPQMSMSGALAEFEGDPEYEKLNEAG